MDIIIFAIAIASGASQMHIHYEAFIFDRRNRIHCGWVGKNPIYPKPNQIDPVPPTIVPWSYEIDQLVLNIHPLPSSLALSCLQLFTSMSATPCHFHFSCPLKHHYCVPRSHKDIFFFVFLPSNIPSSVILFSFHIIFNLHCPLFQISHTNLCGIPSDIPS